MITRRRQRQETSSPPLQCDVLNGGFTLIEMMIAMVIVAMLLSAVYTVYGSLTRSYTAQNVSAKMQQNVRAAVDLMAEDIMMAGLDPNEAAGASFVEASATRIRVTMDRNLNDEIDETDDEQVTYSYAGNTLSQCLYEGTASQDCVPFIDNVTSFSLTYLDRDNVDLGSPASSFSDIRSVIIQVTVREPAGRAGLVERSYSTTIRCRNIGI